MNSKRRLGVFIGFLCALPALACSAPKVKAILAVAVPLSGTLQSQGNGIVRAVNMAVSEMNASNVLAQEIIVRAYDDTATPDGAQAAAKIISADPRVFAVIGDFTSDCSIAASSIYASVGIPMITPSSENSVLTTQQESPSWKWEKCIFRMPPTDLYQASFAAQFAKERLALRSFWIVEDGGPYGMELAQAFGVDFKKSGGKVLGFTEMPPSSSHFSRLIRDLKKSKPQGFFFGGFYPEAARILTALRTAHVQSTFFAGGSAKADELFNMAGPAADGAYFAVSSIPIDFLPSAKKFIDRYRVLFKTEPRAYDAYAYEAAKIAIEALREAGPNRKKIIAALRETRHNGMIGMIRFDGKGDNLNTLITLVRANYRKRKFEPVY